MVLRPVANEQVLSGLLDLAVRDASPDGVMPPVDGPPGWTPENLEAFREFHRARFGGLDGPQRTMMYAILVGADVVGMIRLSRLDEPETMETGIWVGRSYRSRGFAAAALEALLVEAGAAGARTVIAETTPGNAAALGVLRRRGAALTVDGDKVRASIDVTSRRS